MVGPVPVRDRRQSRKWPNLHPCHVTAQTDASSCIRFDSWSAVRFKWCGSLTRTSPQAAAWEIAARYSARPSASIEGIEDLVFQLLPPLLLHLAHVAHEVVDVAVEGRALDAGAVEE